MQTTQFGPHIPWSNPEPPAKGAVEIGQIAEPDRVSHVADLAVSIHTIE
jgi:hypothetical protein